MDNKGWGVMHDGAVWFDSNKIDPDLIHAVVKSQHAWILRELERITIPDRLKKLLDYIKGAQI